MVYRVVLEFLEGKLYRKEASELLGVRGAGLILASAGATVVVHTYLRLRRVTDT